MKNQLTVSLLRLLLFLYFCPAIAGDPFSGGYYWISFTDKLENPYSLERPELFLSQRSINRRLQQGIVLNEGDLPVNPAYIDSLKVDSHITVFYTSRWLNGALIKTTAEESFERIIGLPFVAEYEFVKPIVNSAKEISPDLGILNSALYEMERGFVKDEPFADMCQAYFEDYYSDPYFGYSWESIAQINGLNLLKDGFRGAGKLIAILDAGFKNANHLSVFSHLWESGRIAGTRDFVDKPWNIYGSSPHGTYILSTLAAYQPGLLIGTAPEATYWLIRTEDAATEYKIEEYNWLAGAELADSIGADVINSSLGYSRFDDPDQNHDFSDLNGNTTIAAQAANLAFERGILVVNSAGNYGNQPWQYVGTPSDSFGALSVGAVDTKGIVAAFSSRGPTADGRIKPDVMAHGLYVPVSNLDDGVGLASGTSLSSPLIAGMSASLWGKHPDATASSLKIAIIKSGYQYHDPDTIYGYGIPDFIWASYLLRSHEEPKEPVVIFPNPVSQNSFVSCYSDNHQAYLLEIFDIRGSLFFLSEGNTLFPGLNQIRLFEKIGYMENGIYFLRIVFLGTGESVTSKFVKAS